MQKLIEDFSEYIRAARKTYEQANLKAYSGTISNVLITGLGGSGIGGTTIADVLLDSCSVPVLVNKGYSLPAFASENTLLIASSYSGNTEETVAVFEEAKAKGCEIACVTSGGKIGAFAEELGLNTLLMPGGNPPRSMFGYSFTLALEMLMHYGVASENLLSDIDQAADLIDQEETHIQSEAKKLAHHLVNKVPVIYACDGYDGVATRFRQQVNENGKMLCWHHIIPEMNHNELVGWAGGDDRMAVVFFRNDSDLLQNQRRIDINKEIIGRQTNQIMEIWSKGKSHLEKIYYLVHLGDWCSLYLSEMNEVDVVEVKVIDFLKGELAK